MELISITAGLASLIGVVFSILGLLFKFQNGLRELHYLDSAKLSLELRGMVQETEKLAPETEKLVFQIKLQEKELDDTQRQLLHKKLGQVIETIESKDPAISYEILGDAGQKSQSTAASHEG